MVTTLSHCATDPDISDGDTLRDNDTPKIELNLSSASEKSDTALSSICLRVSGCESGDSRSRHGVLSPHSVEARMICRLNSLFTVFVVICSRLFTILGRLCTSRVSTTCDGGLYPGFDCSVPNTLPECE